VRAVHRSILVVDVAEFGDSRRTNTHQMAVRKGLYSALESVFAEAGVPWQDCHHEDRGDGVLVLVPPEVPKSSLAETLPLTLAAMLRNHNLHHRTEEHIRLRLALHAGEVHYDDYGVVGSAVNHAFRLLNARPLKQALAASPGLLALISSAWFYEEVIRHNPESRPDTYRRVRVAVKETDTSAWICLPDAPGTLSPDTGDQLVPQQLPVHASHFVGRTTELERLTSLVGGPVIITAIDGSAGIGKTTLALRWAHQAKDRFPDGQLHVNLRGFDPQAPMDPGRALHGFLETLGVPSQNVPTDLDSKAALYRSLLTGRRMLIVLDNARNAEQVRPLLPATSACQVIITSRNRMDSLAVREGANRITLDVLSTEDSFALLGDRMGQERTTAEPDAARELVELCARLPLALSIVAARADRQPTLPLSLLVDELRDERDRLDALSHGDTDLDLRAVFSRSYQALSRQATRMFRLLGVHPGPDIDLYACAALAGTTIARTRALLDEITSAHMLTEHSPGRFRFHDLLRMYATERGKDDETERAAATHRIIDHYLRGLRLCNSYLHPSQGGASQPETLLPIATYDDAMAWCTAEHLVVLEVVTLAGAERCTPQVWHLFWAFTTYLRRRGHRHDRVALARAAVAAADQAGDRTAWAVSLRMLASGLNRLGQREEALVCVRAAAEVALGHEDLVQIHLTYARIFDGQQRYEDSLSHAETAWNLARRSDERQEQADALNTMGRAQSFTGRHTTALQNCEQALVSYEELGYLEGQADTLINLGLVHGKLGQHDAAMACFRRSLMLDRQLGDEYWEARALEYIGDTYRETGHPDSAGDLWREAAEILVTLGHPDAEQIQAKLSAPQPRPDRAG
jgi:Tfp pilus assembly protein PilF